MSVARRQVLAGAAAGAGALSAGRLSWAAPRGSGRTLVVLDAAVSRGPDAVAPWASAADPVSHIADGALLDPMALLARLDAQDGGRLVALVGSASHVLLMEAVRERGGRVLLEQRVDGPAPAHLTVAMMPPAVA